MVAQVVAAGLGEKLFSYRLASCPLAINALSHFSVCRHPGSRIFPELFKGHIKLCADLQDFFLASQVS